MLQTDVPMMSFLLPVARNSFAEVRFGFIERLDLEGVMRVNRLLHGNSTGHCGALSQNGRGSAKRKSCEMPKRQQRAGTYPSLQHQFGKRLQMLLLLRLHPTHSLRAGGPPQNGELPSVDAQCTELPGMVHANDPFHHLPRGRIARQPGFLSADAYLLSLRQAKMPSTTAKAKAKIKFIVARDSGRPGMR